MNKSTIKSILLICFLCIMIACDNDDPPRNAKSPRFKSLTLTPQVVEPGGNVHAFVEYEYTGKHIYKNTYEIKVYNSEYSLEPIEWDVLDPTQSNPECDFKAPTTPGIYTVTFRATRINYSTGGESTGLYGSANTLSSTLNVLNPDD